VHFFALPFPFLFQLTLFRKWLFRLGWKGGVKIMVVEESGDESIKGFAVK
jgi:hypothetical protein